MTSPQTRPGPSLPEAGGCWRFGNVRFDERQLRLTVRGTDVEVPKKSLEVLRELLRNAGEVVTKDELAEACWPRRILSETVLTTTIGRLRQALGEDNATAVQTVKGYGYRLAVPVSFDGPAPAPAIGLGLQRGDHPPLREIWQLIEPLGGGGQGDVWLAQSSDGEQRVFKFAADLRGVAALRREQAISRLLQETWTGPGPAGFVPVLDAQFESMPAFVAYAWTGAKSLDQWAEACGGLSALGLDLRLSLAAQCAERLAQAHTAGVLHKDLKPSNILIEDHADGPHLLLADFGSATVSDRERLRHFVTTRMGLTQVLEDPRGYSGTPLYMAPELLAGGRATERSDIYALGILLYQLIVGDFRRPLAAGWESEIADPLLTEDIASCATGEPMRRLGDAAELARRLRSLPERRRQQAEAQQERQRVEQLKQQLARQRQRRPWLIGLMSVLGLSAIVTSVLSWQLNTALADARQQYQVADAVGEFLRKDIIAAANPRVSSNPDPTLKQALRSAEGKLAERFAGQPLQEGAVRLTLGEAWRQIGDSKDAEKQLRLAIALLDPLGSGARRERAEAHLDLATFLGARDMPGVPEHLAIAEQLTQDRPAIEDWRLWVRTQLLKADLKGWAERYDEAIAILEPLLQQVRQRLPETDPVRNNIHFTLVEQLQAAEHLQEALDNAQALLPQTERIYGPHNAETALQRLVLADVLSRLGRHEEALAMMDQAIADRTAVLGPNHREVLRNQIRHASVLARAGQPDQAITDLLALRPRLIAAQGEFPFVIYLDTKLLALLIDRQRWADVIEQSKIAFANSTAYNHDGDANAEDQQEGLIHADLAYALYRSGKLDEAAAHYKHALRLLPGPYGENDPDWARVKKEYQAFLDRR